MYRIKVPMKVPNEGGIGVVSNERGGADTLLVTLLVFPVLLFVCFAGVPFFVYIMKGSHLNVTANHAMKEAEAVGYVSASIQDAARTRLASLGLESMTVDGVSYPSFAGSTTSKVLRDGSDPTVTVVVTYPAPNIKRLAALLRGDPGPAGPRDGYYRIVLYGKSEAYE
jgi:hypothetical protein